MAIYFAALFALCALVAAVGGIAAITLGWVLPNIRRSVERTRLYGLGVLVFAVGMFAMAAGEAASSDLMQSVGRAVGVGILAFSTTVVRASGRPAAAGQGDRG
ncbi:hypothetical protein ACH4S8_36725 [Streptomyces sp. NPDC021080]|uniref:hypothetical protein n=1 Tax=Streptomyces sp. NPDC021080 TaxID=3365110 RepID=UPI0037B8AE99